MSEDTEPRRFRYEIEYGVDLYAESLGYIVNIVQPYDASHGICYLVERVIEVSPDLLPTERVYTLMHEVAHAATLDVATAHRCSFENGEAVAEGAAALVLEHYGYRLGRWCDYWDERQDHEDIRRRALLVAGALISEIERACDGQ